MHGVLQGFIGGYVGPLPYGIEECDYRVNEYTEKYRELMDQERVEMKCELLLHDPILAASKNELGPRD